MKRNKIFCILASLTMLVAAGASASYNNSYVNQNPVVAEAATDYSIDFRNTGVKTSDDGTDVTVNFKTAETFGSGKFSITASSSNMKVESNGLKFQKADCSISFELEALADINFGVYASSTNRSLIVSSNVSGWDNITYTRGIAPFSANILEQTLSNCAPGTYTISNGGGYTTYIQFINVKYLNVETIEPLNVTYDLNFENSVNKETTTDVYGYIANDYVPTREGYDFNGWYSDKECTIPFDFSKTVSEPTTLYAAWTKIISIVAKGNIVGDINNLSGLTLTLEDSEQELTYSYTISDSLTYDFGTIKNGEYTLSINDTTGLINITSAKEFVIDEDTDVIGDIEIETYEKMNKTYSWDITAGFTKGYNGNGLIAGEDMPYKEAGYVQGSSNASPNKNNSTPTTGSFLKFVVGVDGTINFALTFTGTKSVYVTSNNQNIISHEGVADEIYEDSFQVKAGETYYLFGSGTKPMIKAVSYTPAQLNYQYDNDATPTAVRFIGTLSNITDTTVIDTITLTFKSGENEAVKTINTVWESVNVSADGDDKGATFEKTDNTYYVVYSVTNITGALETEFSVTLTVTFTEASGLETMSVNRTFVLGE